MLRNHQWDIVIGHHHQLMGSTESCTGHIEPLVFDHNIEVVALNIVRRIQ